MRNHQGETPGDIAVRKGWKEVPLFTAFQKQLDVIILGNMIFLETDPVLISFLCAGGKPFVSGQTGGASAEHYQRLGEKREKSKWRRRRSKEEEEVEGDDEEVQREQEGGEEPVL